MYEFVYTCTWNPEDKNRFSPDKRIIPSGLTPTGFIHWVISLTDLYFPIQDILIQKIWNILIKHKRKKKQIMYNLTIHHSFKTYSLKPDSRNVRPSIRSAMKLMFLEQDNSAAVTAYRRVWNNIQLSQNKKKSKTFFWSTKYQEREIFAFLTL